MRYLPILLSIYISNLSSAQVSKLRFELSGFSAYNFNYFNEATLSTTPDWFSVTTQLGGVYNKHSNKGIHWGPGERTLIIEYGLMFAYQLQTKWDIRFGVMSSRVGSYGSPGGASALFYSGGSSRLFHFMFLPTYQLLYNRKHRASMSFSTGLSIDFLRNDTDMTTRAMFYHPTTNSYFNYYREATLLRTWGATIHAGLTFSLFLKNNNCINFHAMAGYSPFPLITNNYTYSLTTQDPITQNFSQENYYTELWSTATYFKFGIGYEFQILKKYFSYSPKKLINEKQTYIYN